MGERPVDYPARTIKLLQEASFRDQPIERVYLAMPGYTSYQGIKLCELYARRLQPKIAIVAYGWNDHWLAYGAVDAEKTINADALRLYNNVRLLQLLEFARSRFGRRSQQAVRLSQVRVPIQQYEQNLNQIVALLESVGASVILMTAPTSHGILGVPDYLIEMGFAKDKETTINIHAAYNDVVRAVAKYNNVQLLDLDAELSRKNTLSAFNVDGIHFSFEAQDWVAKRLATFLLHCCNSP